MLLFSFNLTDVEDGELESTFLKAPDRKGFKLLGHYCVAEQQKSVKFTVRLLRLDRNWVDY